MKVLLLGTATLDGRSGPAWSLVRDLLAGLGPSDILVHTGGRESLGAIVDSIVRRAKGAERRRLPRIEVSIPEIGRYEREEAIRRNVMVMLHTMLAQVAVYVGDGLDAEGRNLMGLAGLYPKIRVMSAEEFVAEHGRRD